jgi:putative phage-type endonuclease
MAYTEYNDFQQNSVEWLNARAGILTASDVKKIITPETLQPSKQIDALLFDKCAEIISAMPKEHFETYDMQMGHVYEEIAIDAFCEHYKKQVRRIGFAKRTFTVDGLSFDIGASPDALVVGENAVVEVKSSKRGIAFGIIIEDSMPKEHRIQVQTEMLVTGSGKGYFIHYSGGMHLMVKEILPDPDVQQKIVAAAHGFYVKLQEYLAQYNEVVTNNGYKPLEFIPVLGD